MSNILVSVIIPAHNCTQYIRQALDSALGQNVPLEVIVIDDFSADDLDSVMVPYLADPRVRYLKNQKNLGVAQTRNRGIALARGSYVAFLDADDYWAEGKLEKQLAKIDQTGAVLCSTARELMHPDGSLSGYVISVAEEYDFAALRLQNQVNCSSVLVKTEVAREFPMHNDECHEDYLMWLEILRKYGKGCAVNEPLLKYRISNTGKSGSKLHSAMMTFKTYRCMGFGLLRSLFYFFCYTFYGVRKYFRWFLNRFH